MTSSVVYGAVYRNTVPLVTYSVEPGSWDNVYVNMVNHGKVQIGFNPMQINNMTLGILSEKTGLAFLLVMKGNEESVLIKSLEDLKSDFLRRNLNWQACGQNDLYPEYGGRLKELMDFYGRSQKIGAIQTNMQDSIQSMNEALESALLRGQNLEKFDNLADSIGSSASVYQQDARKLKNKMCWQKYQWYIIGGGIVLLLFLILLFSLCGGFDLKPHCIKPKSE